MIIKKKLPERYRLPIRCGENRGVGWSSVSAERRLVIPDWHDHRRTYDLLGFLANKIWYKNRTNRFFRQRVRGQRRRRLVSRDGHNVLSIRIADRGSVGKGQVRRTELHIQRRTQVSTKWLAVLQEARQKVSLNWEKKHISVTRYFVESDFSYIIRAGFYAFL